MSFTQRITFCVYFDFEFNFIGLPASHPPTLSSAVWSFITRPLLLTGRAYAPRISEVATSVASLSWDKSVRRPYLGFDATFMDVVRLAGVTASSRMKPLRCRTSVAPRDVEIRLVCILSVRQGTQCSLNNKFAFIVSSTKYVYIA